MRRLALAALLICSVDVGSAETVLGTAFTYQGRLASGGVPLTGSYDLQFALYAGPNGGLPVAGPLTLTAVPVASGLFTVKVDFGAAFIGDARWLEIGIGSGMPVTFTVLGPRQELTATPNAVFSATVPWAGVGGKPPGFADNVDDDALGALSCTGGQVPTRIGLAWTCADLPTSLPPTGPAGGSLSGAYPSPVIAAGAVGPAELNATGSFFGQALISDGSSVGWGTPAFPDPRIRINSLPFFIAQPGSYYLTGDLVGVAGQVGILITSSHVTLDLNGFSLIGGPGTLDGIRANLPNTRNVVIRNGTVRDWPGAGIAAAIVTAGRIEGISAIDNGAGGIQLGPRGIVSGCTASGNTGIGIFADQGGGVAHSTAASNSLAGIATGQSALVINSNASSNGTSGITANAGTIVLDSTAQSNAIGFNLAAGSRASRSTARQNSTGFLLSDGASITDSTAVANTDDGIRAANRCLIARNTASGNTNDGIEATGNQNRIEGNHSNVNGSGISIFGTANVVVTNNVSGNVSFTILIVGGGNLVGTISSDPTTAGPWANFEH